MNKGVASALHFGATSGVITTLGLIVGLHSATQSQRAVVGGIVTTAVAMRMPAGHMSPKRPKAAGQALFGWELSRVSRRVFPNTLKTERNPQLSTKPVDNSVDAILITGLGTPGTERPLKMCKP